MIKPSILNYRLALPHKEARQINTKIVSEKERDEILSQERRSMFLGMTRAMRSLLVIVSEGNDSPSFQGFDELYWNVQKHR